MDLRPYRPADKEGCLAVFDSNLPEWFAPEERQQFGAFLDALPGPYWVMEHDGAVVGSAGYAFDSPEEAALCWILVRRDLHRNGLGKFLVFSVMRELGKAGDPATMRLTTIDRAVPFFERQGFHVAGPLPGGFVGMRKKLKVCP